MRFNKPTAILLLIATLLPIGVSLVIICVAMFAVLPNGPIGGMMVFLVLGLMPWNLLLLDAYIKLAVKTEIVRADKRLLWAIALFFTNYPAMLFFWHAYVWTPLQSPFGRSNEP